MGNFREKLADFNTPPYKTLIQDDSPIFSFIMIFGLYFVIFNLRKIVTPDEFAWVIQSIHFRQALIEQDWPRLVQSAHPGFITMWLGSIGTTINLWYQPELQTELDWILQQSWHLPQTGELSSRLYPFLQPARNALSVFMAVLWTAVYALLKRRLDSIVSLIAVFILVTDMWIVGLTNILHVDGLLAMFCLLTLLLVLPLHDDALTFYSNRRYLLAGVTMAGAILSKVPGLLLLAIAPTIVLAQWWFARSDKPSVGADGSENILAPKNDSLSRPHLPVTQLFSVLVGLLLTSAILAPIIFIDPNYVFQNVFVLSAREVGFSAPTFFLGQVTESPGILFYPLTILFRQRAFITLGLIIAAVQLIRTRNGRKQIFFLTAVGTFCLLFWLGLLVSDREFARYALPIYLCVSLIGAISITQFAFKFTPPFSRTAPLWKRALFVWPFLFLLAPMIIHPEDPFEHINFLFGGPWNGKNLMLTGWGGGQSLAAQEIRLDIGFDQTVFTDNVPATASFNGGSKDVILLSSETAWLVEPDDFVILSLEHKQLNPYFWQAPGAGVAGREEIGDWPPLFNRIPADKEPTYTISGIGGDRAWVFTDFDQTFLDQDLSRYTSAGFEFHNRLQMTEATIIKPDNEFNIHLLLRWSHKQPEDGILQFTIVDEAGNVWIQREDPLINIEDIPASRWTATSSLEHFLKTELSIHTLPLASDMPPGDYSVRVSHFQPDGSLSGITQSGEFIGTVAPLATFPVTVPSPQPPVALPENELDHSAIRAVSELPAVIGQGETITADVWLKQSESLGDSFNLLLETGRQSLIFPVDTTSWQEGFTYRIRARWQIPADLQPGDQAIRLNGIDLGTIAVEARERNFELPAGFTAETLAFGNVLNLVGVGSKLAEQNSVRIVWQAVDPDQVDYTIFIHLKDADGNILAQQDMLPGKPTSQTIQNEVIDFTADIPFNEIDPATISTIAIGFYNPTTGQRLPVLNDSGDRLPNDQAEIIIGANDN